jgi:hypothetical protein
MGRHGRLAEASALHSAGTDAQRCPKAAPGVTIMTSWRSRQRRMRRRTPPPARHVGLCRSAPRGVGSGHAALLDETEGARGGAREMKVRARARLVAFRHQSASR